MYNNNKNGGLLTTLDVLFFKQIPTNQYKSFFDIKKQKLKVDKGKR